jgi:hypothetical protein
MLGRSPANGKTTIVDGVREALGPDYVAKRAIGDLEDNFDPSA